MSIRNMTLGALACLLLAASPANAILHVSLEDPESNSWVVLYTFSESREGADSLAIFPYDFPIEIIKAEALKGGRPLKYDEINEGKEGKPKYSIRFPNPVVGGEKFRFRVEARMTDPKSFFLDSRKLTFIYQTAHDVFVSLPPNFLPVYTDEPMEIKQEKGRVVLESRGGERRPVIIFANRCSE